MASSKTTNLSKAYLGLGATFAAFAVATLAAVFTVVTVEDLAPFIRLTIAIMWSAVTALMTIALFTSNHQVLPALRVVQIAVIIGTSFAAGMNYAMYRINIPYILDMMAR